MLILACHIGGFGVISHTFCQFSIFARASDIADLHICTYDYFVKIIFILCTCTYFYCVQFQYVHNHVTDIQICTAKKPNVHSIKLYIKEKIVMPDAIRAMPRKKKWVFRLSNQVQYQPACIVAEEG